MFVDRVRIYVKAGDGGNGCVSFRREKYIDRGGPNGGDGGDGGAVVFVADTNTDEFSDLAYKPRLVAKRGGHGRGKNCSGRNARNVMVKVPIGTQIYKLPGRPDSERTRSDAPAANRKILGDLVAPGQQFVVARGGKGGRGNTHFKSAAHQAPREFDYGEPGEELYVELELKMLADVGLVGFPNAGKSTLISIITEAHPKTAPYPFTTLTPSVGIITFDDYKRIRVADIPGLIAGAHAGKGLGHDFLRHVERCKLLIILLDMAGVDARKPEDDYTQLLEELNLYSPAILKKKRLVVANKMDLPEASKNLRRFKRKHRVRVLEISSLTKTGLDKLRLALRKALI